MNNLKYYNNSLAYDFELFLPKEKPQEVPEDNIVKMPKQNRKRRFALHTSFSHLSVSAFAVVTSILLVAALCANITLRIRVNEVNNKLYKTKNELAVLQSQQTALHMEYESRISYANLEQEATALGMKKLDKSQVVYIRVHDQNMAKDADGRVMVAQ